MNVRCPPEGPFDAGLIGDVEDIVFRLLGRHPDQNLYCIQYLYCNLEKSGRRPSFLAKAFIPQQIKIMAAEKKYPSVRGI